MGTKIVCLGPSTILTDQVSRLRDLLMFLSAHIVPTCHWSSKTNWFHEFFVEQKFGPTKPMVTASVVFTVINVNIHNLSGAVESLNSIGYAAAV